MEVFFFFFKMSVVCIPSNFYFAYWAYCFILPLQEQRLLAETEYKGNLLDETTSSGVEKKNTSWKLPVTLYENKGLYGLYRTLGVFDGEMLLNVSILVMLLPLLLFIVLIFH